jgi:autotransporter adhesin
MNPQWYPVLANAAITLFGLGVIWGTMRRDIKHIQDEVIALKRTDHNHETRLNNQGERISRVEGRLNGASFSTSAGGKH